MPEHLDSALLSALVLLGLTCVIGGKQADTASATELGCLQLLATGQKDLPPVHVCSSQQGENGKLQAESFSDNAEPEYNWIVLWQESGDAAQASSVAACKEAESETAGRFKGKCTASFTSIFNGLSIQLTQSHLLSFVAAYKSHIASVHQDGGVSPTDIQYDAPWPLDRIDQDTLPLNHQYSYLNTGSNVNVYIIDTGIRTSHEEFRYADGRPGSRAREVFSSLSTGAVGQDCTGHGTHVAASVGGLQFGAAKNCTLLAVRALDCNTDSNTGVTQASFGALHHIAECSMSSDALTQGVSG
ncbi:hypothetical protein ABBQ32_009938 [Trebouxia sp. C0010 RCD-2024]